MNDREPYSVYCLTSYTSLDHLLVTHVLYIYVILVRMPRLAVSSSHIVVYGQTVRGPVRSAQPRKAFVYAPHDLCIKVLVRRDLLVHLTINAADAFLL